jgi:hypothetical protein
MYREKIMKMSSNLGELMREVKDGLEGVGKEMGDEEDGREHIVSNIVEKLYGKIREEESRGRELREKYENFQSIAKVIHQ